MGASQAAERAGGRAEGRAAGGAAGGAEGRAALLAALEQELRRSSAQGALFGQAVAERLGINHTDMESLDLLRWAGPVTAGRLAELTGLTTGAVTRMIDRLERDGFVRREPDAADRRRVIVRLVDGAEARVWPLYESLQRSMERLVEGYGDDQLALLVDYFARSYAVLQTETTRLRSGAGAGPEAPGGFAAPLAPGTAAGHLVFPAGAFQVAIDVQAGLPDLLRGRFDGPEPRLRVSGGVVVVDYRHFPFDRRDRGAELVLNGDLPWHIDVRSGASRLTAQLEGLTLGALSFRGGASQAEVTLPAPRGTVPLTLAGGASACTLLRPAGVALRVRVRGGASDLALDGDHFGALGRDWRWETPGFGVAADRYDLQISGGASSVTVDVR